jgi:site-specific DNA-methyltransferase (adenine-specific)
MIYEKSGFANPENIRYHQVFEYMFVLIKGQPTTFNPIIDRINIEKRRGGNSVRQKDGSLLKWQDNKKVELGYYGKRYNIWRYKVGGGNIGDEVVHEHPAAFPEDLAKDHIISWSNPDDLILDPMCGSGTTCKMAKLLGRRYIGIDISPEYCKIAEERLQAVSTGVPVKEARKGQIPLFK